MTVGRYQVLAQLGQGGMATVYKAFQPSLDRTVALKVMRAGLAEDREFKERFAREAKAIARLEHPNIVQVYDYDEIDGRAFMAMAFIEGGTLKEKLDELAKAGERLPQREIARIISQVADGLAYAHGLGIVHRDVKSSNVMLTRDGRAVVSDFGIAKILSGTQYTQAGVGIGTPEYMSPEQAQGKTIDARSDQYALGVMTYEMLVGKLPYTADTPLAVVLMHVRDPLPLPSKVDPGVGQATERVVLKALAKDPAERYASVTDFAAALQRAINEDAGGTQRTVMVSGAGATAATVMVPAGMAAGAAPAALPLVRRVPGGRVGIGAIAIVGFLVIFTALAQAGICPPQGPWPQPPGCPASRPAAANAPAPTGAPTATTAPAPTKAPASGGPAKGGLLTQLDPANPTGSGFTVNPQNAAQDRASAVSGTLQLNVSGGSSIGIALYNPQLQDLVIEATLRYVSGQGGYLLSARAVQTGGQVGASVLDAAIGTLAIQRGAGGPQPQYLAGPQIGAVPGGAGKDQQVTFSVVGRDLVAYVAGTEVLRAQDPTPTAGAIVIGVTADQGGPGVVLQIVSLKVYRAP